MASKGKLTDRERAFVFAYVGPARGNGTEAAHLAGYSGTRQVLGIQATRLLGKARVREAIQKHQAREERAAIAQADEVDSTMTMILRAPKAPIKYRIAAARELNKVAGRHSIKIQHSGRITLEQALTASRSADL